MGRQERSQLSIRDFFLGVVTLIYACNLAQNVIVQNRFRSTVSDPTSYLIRGFFLGGFGFSHFLGNAKGQFQALHGV